MKVFISHVEADRKIAWQIADALRESGLTVWLAEEGVAPGENFAQKIGEALEESDAMVTLVSPASMRSDLVRSEINYALMAPRFEGRLIPVMVRPTKDYPWILEQMPLIDVSKKTADAGKRVLTALRKSQLAHR